MWGINIENSEGVWCGEGLCAPSCGSGGLAQGKKINFVLKNYAILSKFWYVPILQHKNLPAHIRESGGLSPVLKVGDLSPCPPPPAPTPMHTVDVIVRRTERVTL